MQNAEEKVASSITQVREGPIEKSMLRKAADRVSLGMFLVVCTFGASNLYISHYEKENIPPPSVLRIKESTIPILTVQDPTKEGWKESSQESHTVLGLKIAAGFIGGRAPYVVKWYRSGINNGGYPGAFESSEEVGSKDNPLECSITPCFVEMTFPLGVPSFLPRKENYKLEVIDSNNHVGTFEIQKDFRDKWPFFLNK